MNNENQSSYNNYGEPIAINSTGAVAKNYIANVFVWMFVALGISAVTAFLFASNPSLMEIMFSQKANGQYGLNMLGYVVMFAPLGFVMLMSFGFARLSAPALTLLYIAYAAITGISLSFVLLAYTSSSIVTCFAASAGMFGLMAVLGYTTKQDLTSFGRILMMGLIGIIIASLVNFFLKSDTMSYVISFIGVAVFTGLTAYDMQKLKRIGEGLEYQEVGRNEVKKLAILGGLTLYLDFINLFLMLLRLFGSRRD